MTHLSEEFNSASAHLNFQRLHQTEGWPANQLQTFFVQAAEERLVMIPFPSSWYQDYKGPLAYKNVTGDFVATVQVQVRNGAENGTSNGPFSFAGLLVRAPRPDVTSPAGWQAGQEDWIIQAAGTAGAAGVANYEFKSTDDSVTQPNFPGGTDHVVFQIARIGSVFILLRQPVGGSWTVVQRYNRTDLPATLQVGLTAYGNFTEASSVTPLQHNQTVLGGDADLVARFDYYRLQRPVIPANLQGLDFMNPAQISDAQLLTLFADNANPVPATPAAPVISAQPQSQTIIVGHDVTFAVVAGGNPTPTFQWRRNGVNINGATSASYTLNSVSTNDHGVVFSVVVSNSEGSATSANVVLSVNALPPPANDDIAHLSDEFDNAATLSDWQRVYQTEGWGFDQLEQWDINQSDPGRMTMMPYTSSWFQEWRGVQVYKQVTGDFVVTTDVEPTSRSGSGPPNRQFSLSGIMVRAPRNDITNGRADWTPNGENYIFLSMGAASQAGTPQFEVKTTMNSASNLEITPGGSRARIQVARLGSAFIVLRQIDNSQWEVHRRYHRPDLPSTMNVGLTTYTDWGTCNAVGFEYHNTNRLVGSHPRLTGGNVTASPDLIARFDYVRYRRPAVPANLVGHNFVDPVQVTDAELLAFLAANANTPAGTTNPPPVVPTITQQPTNQTVEVGGNAAFSVVAAGTPPLSYQWRRNGADLAGVTSATYSFPNVTTNDSGASFSVIVSNAAGTVVSTIATLTVTTPSGVDLATGFPNVTQAPGRLLTPLLEPQQGRSAVIAWHNGHIYSFPEQPSSQPGSDFIARRFDLSDLSNVRAVEELGQTPQPVMAHGYLYIGANLVAGGNFPPEAPWSFRAVAPGVNQRTTTPGLLGAFVRGHLYQPWGVNPTYWSYDGNTQASDAALTYDGQVLSTFDHLGLSGGVIGHPFIVGNILIYASDQSRTGVATYDISDPTNPVLLDVLKTGGAGGYWPELWGGDGKLYVVFPYRTGGRGMRVVDVTDPASLRFIADEPLPGDEPMYIQFQDEFAFMGSHKVDMRTLKSVLRFDAVGQRPDTQDVDTSQFLLPVGNLLVTGGSGPFQGMAVWAHQAEPDLRGPSVGYHIPRDGQSNYPVGAPISLLIHETLRSQTIEFGANLIVRPLGGQPITARWTYAFNDTLTISPDQPLLDNTSYEVIVVGGGIKDAVGNGIEPHYFTFSTGASVGGNQPPVIASLTASTYPAATNQAITLTAAASDPEGGQLEYRFDFGDGAPRTDWSANNSAQYSYPADGHYPVNVQARDLVGAISTRALNVTVVSGFPAGLAAAHSSQIALNANTREVWVVNPDNNSVQTVNADTLATGTERSVGADPRNLAIDATGNAWVTCHDADRIDIVGGASVQSINLDYGSAPFGIVMTPDGGTAYVALQGSGEVIRINTTTRTITDSLIIGPTPRALALSSDGTRLYVTRFLSPKDHAIIWEVDAVNLSLLRVFRLIKFGGDEHRNSTAEGLGVANQLSSIAFNRDGTRLIVTANKMNTDGGAASGTDLDDDNTVRNVIMFVDIATGLEVRTIDVDNSDSATAVAFSPLGDYFFVTLQGNNEVAIFDALNAGNVAGLGGFVSRRKIGSAPQAVVADSVTRRLFVKNLMSRDVTVLELDAFLTTGALTIPTNNVVTVGNELMSPVVRRGKEIFYHAGDRRMSAEGYISCATCHTDGSHDGRVWDFTGRGEGIRNTIDLRGRLGMGHGNVHWSANFDEIQDFEHDIRGAFGGHGFLSDPQFDSANTPLGPMKAGMNADLDALAAYVSSLGHSSIPRSPHRVSDGSLTSAAQAGAVVFAQQNCNTCHAGDTMTDGLLHNVGSLRPTSGRRLSGRLPGIDTPTLRGVWDTPPYFHDGSAATLAEVFTVAGGDLYPAENASPTGAATVVEGQNNFLNWDETTFGSAAMQLNGVGSMTFNGINGGSGGLGAIEFRYAASYNPQALIVRVNGVDHQTNLPLPYNQPAWRRVSWLSYRVENVQLAAGPNNTVVLDLPSGGAMAVDHIIVSTPDHLAQAEPHRRVLDLTPTDRDNLIAYLRQLDGSPINNGPAAPPLAVITQPSPASLGETLTTDEVSFLINFNVPVNDFTAADLDLGGTAEPQSINLVTLNPGRTWRVDFANMAQAGTISVGIVANAVTDGGGRMNPAILPVSVHWQPFVDDLASLSDEFDDPSTLANWSRVNSTEGWQADQLRHWSVHTDRTNHMRLEPHTAVWVGDYRAPLTYKLITGDFIATIRLDVRQANGLAGWPTGNYSMGGLMVRAPKTNTASAANPATPGSTSLPWPPNGYSADWQPGQEDWISIFFGRAWDYTPDQWWISVGYADDSVSDSYQTTAGIPSGSGIVTLQIARVGQTFLMLRKHGDGPWIVAQRYHRADLPATVQVGIGATGSFGNLFGNAQFYSPGNNQVAYHYNRNVLTENELQNAPNGFQNPNVSVDADYFRLLRVRENLTESMLQAIPVTAGNSVTRPLSGSDLANILGDRSNVPPGGPVVTAPSIATQPVAAVFPAGSNTQLAVVADGAAPLNYQWSRNGIPIPGAAQSALSLNTLVRADSGNYTVTVSNPAGSITSQPALVRVLVPQRILHPARQPNGRFRLIFGDHDGSPMTAAAAQYFEVWAVNDLGAGVWARIHSPISTTGNMLYLDDDQSMGEPQRFYRILER